MSAMSVLSAEPGAHQTIDMTSRRQQYNNNTNVADMTNGTQGEVSK